jgi:hypothetical protein
MSPEFGFSQEPFAPVAEQAVVAEVVPEDRDNVTALQPELF